MKTLLLDIGEFHLLWGDYFISREGLVLSLKWGKQRILKPHVNCCGYLAVKVENKSEKLHRLLALTFIPNPDNKSDVNHKDGNKLNNNLSNLEWVSRRENLHHAMDNGLHALGRRSVIAIPLRGGQILRFKSQSEAKDSGFQQPNITKCLHGQRRSHRGYRWEFA